MCSWNIRKRRDCQVVSSLGEPPKIVWQQDRQSFDKLAWAVFSPRHNIILLNCKKPIAFEVNFLLLHLYLKRWRLHSFLSRNVAYSPPILRSNYLWEPWSLPRWPWHNSDNYHWHKACNTPSAGKNKKSDAALWSRLVHSPLASPHWLWAKRA